MKSLPFFVRESSALFMDAYALDGDRWIFGSFWASETVLQEFFARLTLPNHESGLRSFTLEYPAGGQHKRIQVGDAGRLSKISAKTPTSTILGSMCNVWIFDPSLQKPDRSKGECYVIENMEVANDHNNLRVWNAVKDLSSLPLLDQWQGHLLSLLRDREWIIPLDGFGVQGVRVSLPGELFEALVSDGIRSAQLSLEVSETQETSSDTDESL